MNIFVLDRDPKIAAYQMCDKHVVKMILESAQMLSAVLDCQYKNKHRSKDDEPVIERFGLPGYPKAHTKHPCTLWVRASKQNDMWLVKHMRALCFEYFKRYNKFHKYDAYPLLYEAQLKYCEFEQPCATEFVQAITNKELHRDDPVEAYREYYRKEKAHFCTWKHGDIPEWFSNDIR